MNVAQDRDMLFLVAQRPPIRANAWASLAQHIFKPFSALRRLLEGM